MCCASYHTDTPLFLIYLQITPVLSLIKMVVNNR